MRKSLFISFDFPPKRGGISRYLWQVANSLPPEKVVILTEPAGDQAPTPFGVYRKKLLTAVPFIWPKWLPLFWLTVRLVRRENIKLIHAVQILPFGTVALLIKLIFRIPYVVYVYGQDLVIMRRSVRKMRLIRSILRNAQSVIANSHYTASVAVSAGASTGSIAVIYPAPAAAMTETATAEELSAFRNRYQLLNQYVILTVGNLVERKGHASVIQSLPVVLKTIPQLMYVIVGTGPFREQLSILAKKLHVEKRVLFLDRVADAELPLFYQVCDLFAMPSREIRNNRDEVTDVEGFGIVFLEANRYAKPVIGGRSGGIPEAVADKHSGLLVDPDNQQEITTALLALLTDRSYAKTLGKQGKERAIKSFAWSEEIAKIKKICA